MNQYHLPIILIWTTYNIVMLECSTCFEPEKEKTICTESNNFTKTPKVGVGYDFGFGSIKDLEDTCRTQWHIKVYDCMKAKVNIRCEKIPFYKIIWEFTLDTERLKKGVNYICEEENLRIFNEHKSKCLIQHENEAQSCLKFKAKAVAETLIAIGNRSQESFRDQEQYYANIKMILNKHECKALKLKLDCLYELLYSKCAPDAVRLILNYFTEILPSDCFYYYEKQLQNYLDKTKVKPIFHSTISPYPVFKWYKKNNCSMKSVEISLLHIFVIFVLYQILDLLLFC